MINRIIGAMLVFDMLLAVVISLVFVAKNMPIQPVQIGSEFLSFINTCSGELNNHKIAIPNIPDIPKLDNVFQNYEVNWWSAVLDFFVNFANAFFGFINGIIKILNFMISIINVIIQLIELIVIIFKNAIVLKESVDPMPMNSSSWYQP